MKISRYKEFIKENSEESPNMAPGSFVNLDGVKLYHGSIGYEIKDKKDLNPLFRETPEYIENQKNLQRRRRTTSSDSGVGIYFGRTSTEIRPEDARQYYDNPMADNYETRGFLYEMTLKPGSKVILEGNGIEYISITKEQYQELMSKGIDAVSQRRYDKRGAGLVLLNPDAVGTWKEISRWETPYEVILYKINPDYLTAEKNWKPGDILPNETIEVERKIFWNKEDVLAYYNKYGVEPGGNGWTKDDNSVFSRQVVVKRPDRKYIES